MKKLWNSFVFSRTLVNICKGAGTGLFVWLLHLVIYRAFGLEPAFFLYVAHIMFFGMVIGAVIGLISDEILWHTKK